MLLKHVNSLNLAGNSLFENGLFVRILNGVRNLSHIIRISFTHPKIYTSHLTSHITFVTVLYKYCYTFRQNCSIFCDSNSKVMYDIVSTLVQGPITYSNFFAKNIHSVNSKIFQDLAKVRCHWQFRAAISINWEFCK